MSRAIIITRGLLNYYQGKLKELRYPPIDYAEGLRLTAMIGALQHLLILLEDEQKKCVK